jgi:hypothetical protein
MDEFDRPDEKIQTFQERFTAWEAVFIASRMFGPKKFV